MKEIKLIISNLLEQKHQTLIGSLVNYTKGLRKKFYKFPTIFFRS
jgi:hypothetical protein